MGRLQMSKLQITKSTYTAGLQCPKRVYLLSRQPELAASPSEDLLLRFTQGQSVGQLARAQFADGVLVAAGGSALAQALTQTQELIKECRVPAIFEAAFEYQSMMVRVDILKNNCDGTWDLIEVKSTTEVKNEHLEDVAFQLLVLKGAGVPIKNVVLSHINNEVVYPHLDGLFKNHDFTDAAHALLPQVTVRIKSLINVLEREQAPEQLIGRQCSSPYACEFKKECWASVPKGSTLELYNYRKRKPTKFELYHQGTRMISDLTDQVELTRFQQIQVAASKTDEAVIDRGGLAQFLSSVQYPIYYFDFETIAPAIPILNGMRPYQRIPVQFSCHIQRAPQMPLEHHEFLASGLPGIDPREECLRAMKSIFGSEGSIIAYHDDFERSLIREMAVQFAGDANFLLDLEQRFWDLEDAFHHYFYQRDFGGSVSIKKVLPYFAPEMKYDKLEIQNGGQAQAQLFKVLSGDLSREDREKIRRDLLTYCAQDSMAMVVIHQKLIESVGANLQFLPQRKLGTA